MAAIQDNNFKNLDYNPSITLSCYSWRDLNGKKITLFFSGSTVLLLLSKKSIPPVEVILFNNIPNSKVAQKLISKLKNTCGLKKSIFYYLPDYDKRGLYNSIKINKIKANPRYTKYGKIFGFNSCSLCGAGLEMASFGAWIEGLRMRTQFC